MDPLEGGGGGRGGGGRGGGRIGTAKINMGMSDEMVSCLLKEGCILFFFFKNRTHIFDEMNNGP